MSTPNPFLPTPFPPALSSTHTRPSHHPAPRRPSLPTTRPARPIPPLPAERPPRPPPPAPTRPRRIRAPLALSEKNKENLPPDRLPALADTLHRESFLRHQSERDAARRADGFTGVDRGLEQRMRGWAAVGRGGAVEREVGWMRPREGEGFEDEAEWREGTTVVGGARFEGMEAARRRAGMYTPVSPVRLGVRPRIPEEMRAMAMTGAWGGWAQGGAAPTPVTTPQLLPTPVPTPQLFPVQTPVWQGGWGVPPMAGVRPAVGAPTQVPMPQLFPPIHLAPPDAAVVAPTQVPTPQMFLPRGVAPPPPQTGRPPSDPTGRNAPGAWRR